jgi:hypothetical protein
VKRLGISLENVNGDCLIAAGSLTYAGPFIAEYREKMELLWRESNKDFGIKFTENISMTQLLGNDI